MRIPEKCVQAHCHSYVLSVYEGLTQRGQVESFNSPRGEGWPEGPGLAVYHLGNRPQGLTWGSTYPGVYEDPKTRVACR